eukprot:Gb_38099 [translate_table: standard]
MERNSLVARDFLGLSNRVPESKSGRDLSGLKEGELNCPTNGMQLGSASVTKECMFGGKAGNNNNNAQVQTEADVQQREELKRYFKDKVCLANMALQWPYSNKAAALQQFMSFKNFQEERPKKNLCDQLANSGFHPISTADAFDISKRSTAGTQKNFNLDPSARNTAELGNYYSGQHSPLNRHFGVSHIAYPAQALDDRGSSAYNIQEIGTYPCSNHSPSISNLGSPAFFKGQQAMAISCVTPMVKPLLGTPFAGQHSFLPVVGASTSTTIPGATPIIPGKPANAQLTIFYAGTVNVYDEVPADKAQAIMFLAGSGNSWSGKIDNPPPQTPAMSMPTGGHIKPAPPVCSSMSNPLPPINVHVHPQKSQASIQTSQSTTVSSSAGDLQTTQMNGTPTNQQEAPKLSAAGSTPNPIMPRAVPQARKASLARFLEKRKERVCTKVPYPSKKSPEHSSHREKSLSPKHSSSLPLEDGCKSQQQDGSDGKFVPKSEDMADCVNKDRHEKAWSLKAEKNDIRDCEMQMT